MLSSKVKEDSPATVWDDEPALNESLDETPGKGDFDHFDVRVLL